MLLTPSNSDYSEVENINHGAYPDINSDIPESGLYATRDDHGERVSVERDYGVI